MRPSSLLSDQVLGDRKPHGTRVRYIGGCRCVPCRAANSRYESERLRARRDGDWNGLVSARKARRHLIRLSRAGGGRNAVAAASDVSRSLIAKIRSGRQTTIRARTERRVLGLTKDAIADHALVDAATTWRRIERLLDEGFSKAELARRLGYRSQKLQFGPDQVCARSAVRVERFYRRLMME